MWLRREPKAEVGAREDGVLWLCGEVCGCSRVEAWLCELGALCWTSEAGCSREVLGGWGDPARQEENREQRVVPREVIKGVRGWT